MTQRYLQAKGKLSSKLAQNFWYLTQTQIQIQLLDKKTRPQYAMFC